MTSIPSDATATTGEIYEHNISVNSEDYCLVGVFHKYNEGVPLDLNEIPTITNINFKRCSNLNVIVLLPLIPRSFVYNLVTYPLSAQKSVARAPEQDTAITVETKVFKAVTDQIIELGQKLNLNIECDPGDGDNRLRSLQHGGEFSKMPHTDIKKHEYAPNVCFNSSNKFTIQDILHIMKKLINNTKYLSTQLLLMCNTDCFDINVYTIRWDIIYDAVCDHPLLRRKLRKSSLLLLDKQDPSVAAEFSRVHDDFEALGYKSMAGYLKCMNFLIMAFFDKSIDMKQRIIYIWTARTFFLLWKEHLQKRKMVGNHFITLPTYKDFLTCCDGILSYFIKCVSEYPKSFILPWLVSSDPLEQTFAKINTGEGKGRQTNKSVKKIVTTLGKYNQEFALEDISSLFLPETVAHSRGKTVYDNLEIPLNDQGRDYKMKDIVSAMNTGATWGEYIFTSASNFKDSYLQSVDAEEEPQNWDDISDDDGEETAPLPNDELLDENIDNDELYLKRYIRRLIVKELNEGGNSYPAKARCRRFYSTNYGLEVKHYQSTCDCEDKIARSSKIGGNFRVRDRSKESKDTTRIINGTGTVLFMSISVFGSSQYKHAGRSSVTNIPAQIVCRTCETGTKYWLQLEDGTIVNCDQID